MKFGIFFRTLGLLSLVLASSLTMAEEEISATTVEGLQLIKDSDLALVYAEPGADLSQYNRIYLDDAYISFRKHWRRDQNRYTPHRVMAEDMAKMKVELASLFREVFSRTLKEGGYELVTERAENVLLIKPAIINLDVISPDTMDANRGNTYSETTGEMTLYLELYDSVTDDLIAKAMDRKIDRQTGFFQWQTRITNRAAANRILQVWANVLKEGLDGARSING